MSVPHRLAHRIGRRGATLLFLGLLDAVYAVSLFTLPPETQASPSFVFLGQFMPFQAWGAMWGAVGATCLVQAFMRSDRVAFAAATLLKCAFGLVHLLGYTMYDVPRGYVSAVIWLAFGGWIAIISTWPEAVRLAPDRVGSDHPDAIVTADQNGLITGWQGSAERMFGWAAHDVLGKPITMLMPSRYRASHERGIERVRMTRQSPLAGQTLDAYALDRDGHEFPVQVLIGVVDAPAGLKFTTVVRDLRRRP